MATYISEQEVLSVDQDFHPFPLKIGNAILHEKLCPSTNWTTFILVDFEVFK
jgi:hypothetical protein